MSSTPRLVVFSDDWGRHPSSCQHLIAELLPRYRVDWINTIGTRRPTLSRHDLARAAEKLRGWLRPRATDEERPRPLPPNLTVHSPVHWPGFKSRVERGLNLTLFLRALKPLIHPSDPPTAIVTTASIPADVAKARPDLNWVYYCVDDLSEWPGLDGATLLELERELITHVKTCVAVSEHLRERLRGFGLEATLVTHGIDLEHWKVERLPREAGARPVALYWGNADRRLDSALCLALADALTLRIVGPATDVDPALRAQPSIEWTGPVPYAALPAEAARADVLVMPYADLPVTRAMQPLKLKEYLATGLPVVATPIPANLAWAGCMDQTFDPAQTARLALERARSGLPADQRAARERLAEETWTNKAREFEDALLAHAPSSRREAGA